MNYIKQLQKEIAELKAELNRVEDGNTELKQYLLSPKFKCGSELDSYVNVQDVLNRLPNVQF